MQNTHMPFSYYYVQSFDSLNQTPIVGDAFNSYRKKKSTYRPLTDRLLIA